MTHLFYLALYTTICFALALATSFFLTRTSRATTQRIREATYHDRNYRRDVPMNKSAGGRLFAMVHGVRALLGLSDNAALSERLANAGYRGIYPADLYNAARILSPLFAVAAGSCIPLSRTFWMFALDRKSTRLNSSHAN